MSVSYVILNWKQAKLTKECIRRLRSQTVSGTEIIVVDNEASKASRDQLKTVGDIYIANNENKGFAAACNQGAMRATGQYLAFINNDTKLPNEWTQRAVSHLNEEGAAAISGGEHISSELTYSAAIVHPRTGLVFQLRKSIENRCKVPYCYGSNLLISRQDFMSVGGFAESYFAYYEDVDLCAKLFAHGKKSIYDPTLSIRHNAGLSTAEGKKDFRNSLIQNNKYRLIARHFSGWIFWAAYTVIYDVGKWGIGSLVAILTTHDDIKRQTKLSVYRAQRRAAWWAATHIASLARERRNNIREGNYSPNYRLSLQQFKKSIKTFS